MSSGLRDCYDNLKLSLFLFLSPGGKNKAAPAFLYQPILNYIVGYYAMNKCFISLLLKILSVIQTFIHNPLSLPPPGWVLSVKASSGVRVVVFPMDF